MSRPLRIDYPNGWHHVMNRARRGGETFLWIKRIISNLSICFKKQQICSILKAVRRGIENEPRDVVIYLIRSMRCEPLIRVGAGFGLNRYSSVSSAAISVKTKPQKDRKFNDRLECIESNILKGQT
jgi:chromosomal replication initiation ATPase DnaA